MTVINRNSFYNDMRGAGLTEVLMAMAIIAVATPFVYTQVAQTTQSATDIRIAKAVMDLRGPVLNFIRMNESAWPDTAQIRLSDEDLEQFTDGVSAGFVDKYRVSGATITDVFLAFDFGFDARRTSSIARYIGLDAAVVGPDGIAYGNSWAVTAPDFKTGNLIYKISRDITGEDTEKYLHRGTSGEEGLNVMARDLNMGGYNVYEIGGISAKSTRASNLNATFIDTPKIMTNAVYFSSGANIDGGVGTLGAMRVTGDITGFRNISAQTLNGNGYTTKGRIISDRATVTKAVHVSRDLNLKPDTARTISGFSGISAGTVATPFISADEIIFFENFGLTLSGELLMSTTPPLRVGSWTFPSNALPRFSELTLARGTYPAQPNTNEFATLINSGWKDAQPKNDATQNYF